MAKVIGLSNWMGIEMQGAGTRPAPTAATHPINKKRYNSLNFNEKIRIIGPQTCH